MREKTYKKAHHVSLFLLLPILLVAAILFMAKPAVSTAYASESDFLSQTSDGQIQMTILSQMSEDVCLCQRIGKNIAFKWCGKNYNTKRPD